MKAYLMSSTAEPQGTTPRPKVTLPTPLMPPLQYNHNNSNVSNHQRAVSPAVIGSPPSSPQIMSTRNHAVLHSGRSYQDDYKEDQNSHFPQSNSPLSLQPRKRNVLQHGSSSKEKKATTAIEHIQRIKGCMYSSSSQLIVALKQPSKRQQDTSGHNFKEEYLDDDYNAPDEEVDLMLWR